MKFRPLLVALLLALFAPLTHAAVTIVQSANANTYGNATSQSITLTSTPTVGDYIILEAGFRGISSGFAVSAVTDNQTGNTYSAVVSGSAGSGTSAAAIYLAKVTAATGTYTITVSMGSQQPNVVLYAMEVSGISGATDQATAVTFGSSRVTSFPVAQGAANTNANDLVVSFLAGGTYGTTAFGITDPPSSGYTSIGKIDYGCCYDGAADAGYKTVSAIETDSASWTTTTAMTATGLIASFPSATGGGGGGAGSVAIFNQIAVPQWTSVTTNTALSVTEPAVLCNAASGAITITLPTAVNSFTTYQIKKTDNSSNSCTIATTNSQTVDGSSSLALSSQNSSASLFSDNSNWWQEGGSSNSGVSARTIFSYTCVSEAQATTDYCVPTQGLVAGASGALVPAGTFTKLYVQTTNAPASGQTFTATVYTGAYGSLSGSTITCQITSAGSTCNDTSHTATVTAGQAWTIQIISSATSGATGVISLSLEFDPS